MNPRDRAQDRAKRRDGPAARNLGRSASLRGTMNSSRSPDTSGLGLRFLAAASLFFWTLGSGTAHAEGATATLHRVEGPDTAMLLSFGILAGMTLLGALATITRRNPVTAAMCLVWTLFCSAGLYILLHASFLAVIQVLVYAGAIMVLFVIVVMSVDRPEEEELGLTRGLLTKIVGILGLSFLLILFVMVLSGPEVRRATSEEDTLCGGAQKIQCTGNFECRVTNDAPDAAGKCVLKSNYGDVKFVGRLLFSKYLFPFEAISLLLLVSIVGAVVVSRRRQRPTAEGDAEAEAEAEGGAS